MNSVPKRNTNFFKKIVQAITNSFIFTIFCFIADFIYSKIVTSFVAKLLSSYNLIKVKYRNSLYCKFISKITLSPQKKLKIKNKIQILIGNSFFYNSILYINNYLLATKARIYGVVFVIYGFCASSVGFIKTYIALETDNDYLLIFQGVLLVFLALPLLFSKKNMGMLLVSGKISGWIISDLISIKKEKFVRDTIDDNIVIPVFVGLVLGVSSLVISPFKMLIFALFLIYIGIVFCKIEFGVIIAVATVPFLPVEFVCLQILLLAISFVCKALSGKRTIKSGPLEISVFVFGLFILLGGVFSASYQNSIKSAGISVCLLLSYFLIVNLIKNTQWLNRLIYFIITSFFICSIVGVWQNFFGNAGLIISEFDFSLIGGRVFSTFESPTVFAQYLILIIPLAITLFFMEGGIKKSRMAIVVIFSIASLVFTWSRGAWIGFVASMLIYFVIKNKRAIGTYILIFIALLIAHSFLNEIIVQKMGDISISDSYVLSVWEDIGNMLEDCWITGIGFGTETFSNVYPFYSSEATGVITHSHSLYIQILIELGIFGLLAFIMVIVLALTKCFTYIQGSDNRTKFIPCASIIGIIGILIFGFTDYVWNNYRVYMMFWVVFSILSASINIYENRNGFTYDEEDVLTGGKNDKAEIEIQI